jgi:hypothetical protein
MYMCTLIYNGCCAAAAATDFRWNLDSRLPAPCRFVAEEADVADGGAARLRIYLQQQLACGAHIMLVYRQQQQQDSDAA